MVLIHNRLELLRSTDNLTNLRRSSAVKKLLVSAVVVVAVAALAWIYLFQGYIAGSRRGWVKYRLGIDSPHVIMGKDGLLFTKGSQDDIDDYRGLANPG